MIECQKRDMKMYEEENGTPEKYMSIVKVMYEGVTTKIKRS